MCVFGDIILCHWIGDTASCCGRGEVRVPAIELGTESACGVYARVDDRL